MKLNSVVPDNVDVHCWAIYARRDIHARLCHAFSFIVNFDDIIRQSTCFIDHGDGHSYAIEDSAKKLKGKQVAYDLSDGSIWLLYFSTSYS